MTLIASAQASIFSEVVWIFARATRGLIARRGIAVDQLGKRIVGENLQTAAVAFVYLQKKRMVNRIVVGPELRYLVKKGIRPCRRTAKVGHAEKAHRAICVVANFIRS